jgi:hypothetical protein
MSLWESFSVNVEIWMGYLGQERCAIVKDDDEEDKEKREKTETVGKERCSVNLKDMREEEGREGGDGYGMMRPETPLNSGSLYHKIFDCFVFASFIFHLLWSTHFYLLFD